jgi:hypothetical protein
MISIFKQFKAMVERQLGKQIKIFRSDNSKGEFGPGLQLELKNAGILFEPSLLYKHSINSVVKKAIELVNRRARLIIYYAKLPNNIWDYAVKHAVYLKNQVLMSANKEIRTPLEAFIGYKPDI